MDDYAGRVLADRYRLPLPPSDEYELAETRAFDTYSGQEVLVRQVPLPEVVDAEVVDGDGAPAPRRVSGRAVRRPTDPAVRRAIEAAQSAAQIPDHPRLDQVFDVFAEAGSLWIVSELVAARPLAALLAERPLNPFRAAEIASDVLTAVRVVHAHGWTHRNITVRTVLVCDDGRVVLTGLAAGAAEEALCGYAPVPDPPDQTGRPGAQDAFESPGHMDPPGPVESPGHADPHGYVGPGDHSGTQDRLESRGPDAPEGLPGAEASGPPYELGPTAGVPGGPGRAALETARSADGPYEDGPYADGSDGEETYGEGAYGEGAPAGRYDDGTSSGTSGAMPRPHHGTPGIPAPYGGQPALPGGSASGDIRAARAGAIAAYRAGARAAARANEDQRSGAHALPPLPEPGTGGETGTGSRPVTGEEGQDPRDRPSGSSPDPDWWAQPRPFAESDPDEDDDPPTPYRAELAGVWRDGPAPWNDTSGSVPAGGGASGSPGGGADRGGTPALPPGGSSGPGAAMARGGDSPYTGPGSGGAGGRSSGGGWQNSGARDAFRADAQRQSAQLPAVAGQGAGTGRWDEVVASGSVPAYRGPATPLAAERARQARIAVVGAVTERWAPEQAGPIHENWQLAPPIGPATDLWALGALLYRAVQGHAPYPEENAVELVQLVCAEPPAFAEECGPLRPVVESLLRQDPTERPDFEELRGWLRSLVRSAPEPEAGLDVVPLPSDEARLPIVRRRGELVRKRRRRNRDRDLSHGRHRHKKGKERREKGGRGGFEGQRSEQQYPPSDRTEESYEPYARADRSEGLDPSDRTDRLDHLLDRAERLDRPERPDRSGRGRGDSPRSLGRILLLLILLLLVAAIMYAVMFMPRTGTGQGQSVGEANPGASATSSASGSAAPPSPTPEDSGASEPNASAPQTSGPAVDLADGYVLRKDTEGFQTAVDKDWRRRPINDSGQVRYEGGDFTLIVVPGRDSVADNGGDPLAYQRDKERELQPFRDSSWSSASGLRRVDVGRQAMAEGQYTWQDSNGRSVYVRNLAMIIDGRYHVVQVIGPDGQRDKVSEIYQQAITAYRMTG
ncbi:serine/threonine protein kinase [Streptomyces sp. NPDC088116]|uniref:serine/threonine protein kinase n=1 Tax=Streptomyces sp. NPDC088116 TaxID=3365825 RepID=UPI003808029F